MSKKLFYIAALLLGLAVIGKPALAAEFKADKQMVSISASDTVNGDLYAASSDLSVDANMPGDAFVAGSIVRVSGNVAQSLYAAGSMVSVTGNVGHALHVAGSQVTIGGTIEGDVTVAGGVVYILPNAVIKGDLYVGGGSVTIDGKVLGEVKVGGGDVVLRNEVGKGVYAEAEKLTLGPQAKINGDLTYKAPNEMTMSQGATVTGFTHFQKVARPQRGMEKNEAHRISWAWIVFWFLVFFVFYLVTALLLNHFFKQRVAEITTHTLNNFARQTGWGFIWLIILPVACIILMCTIVGIPLALFGLIFYCLVTGLSKILAGIILGAWLMKLINKKRGWHVDWKAILLGEFAILFVLLVPFVGWLFVLIFMLAALGGIMNALKPIAK